MSLSNQNKTLLSTPLLLSGVFFFLDQFLKYTARTNPTNTFDILRGTVGWRYFENTGIAFGIPFPKTLLLIVTPIVLFFLLRWFYTLKNKTTAISFAISLITIGALSNLLDRILFGFTIDYLHIATSVINIADVMIVFGGLLLLTVRHPERNPPRRMKSRDPLE